jgi:hypothetical protein
MTGSLLVGLALLKLGAFVGRVPRSLTSSGSAGAALARSARPEGAEGRSGSAEVEAELPADLLNDLPEVFATAQRSEWTAAASWMTGFFLMLWLLGALVTVPLFAVAYLLIAVRRSLVLAGTYALVSWMFVYGLFDRVLHIPLPAGVVLRYIMTTTS